MKTYYMELTDLFCGELNYSYIRRYQTKSKSIRGAINKLSRVTGLNFRVQYNNDYDAIYWSKSALTGVYIEEMELNVHDYKTQCYREKI